MKKLLLSFIILGLSPSAFSALSTAETAEILPLDKMQLGAEVQLNASDSEFNFAGHFDKALTESSQMRGTLGSGKNGLLAGVSYKWTPYPDYDKQPAIGFRGGINYWRSESINVLNLTVQPIFSKKYDTSEGLVIPYISIPVGVSFVKSKTLNPMQFVMGAEYGAFGAEFGLELRDSFNYILIYWNYLFDEPQGTR